MSFFINHMNMKGSVRNRKQILKSKIAANHCKTYLIRLRIELSKSSRLENIKGKLRKKEAVKTVESLIKVVTVIIKCINKLEIF